MLTNQTPSISGLETVQTPLTSSTRGIFNSLTAGLQKHGFVIFNCGSDSISKFLNVTFWLSWAVDVMGDWDGANEDEFFSSMSLNGFFIAGSIALIASTGSLYTHFILNTNATFAADHIPHTPDEENDSELDAEMDITTFQSIMLWLDALVHTGDGAGNWLVLFSLTKLDPDRVARLFVWFIATLIGVTSAVANARTCWYNMHIHNNNIALEAHSIAKSLLLRSMEYLNHMLAKVQNEYPDNQDLPKISELIDKVIVREKDRIITEKISKNRRHRFHVDPPLPVTTESTSLTNGTTYLTMNK